MIMHARNVELSSLSIHNIRFRDTQCIPVQSKVVNASLVTKAPAAVCVKVRLYCVCVCLCEMITRVP